MLVIEGKCSKMQKPLQDHIKWIFAAWKIIRAILLQFLSFLAYAGISQSTFCSFGFILSRAMGVTTAKDKSDINSCGFGISKFSADPSAWQAGNFVITKCCLKVPMFITMGGEERIFYGRVTGEDVEHSGWGWHRCCFAHLVLCHPTSDGSSRGGRVMGAAGMAGWWEQQGDGSSRGGRTANCSTGASGWQPCRKRLQSCTHLCCSTTGITLPAHWVKEEKDG